MREGEQNHIAQGGQQGADRSDSPAVAEEFARLLEELKQGLRPPPEQPVQEIPVTAQPGEGVRPSSDLLDSETAESGTKFTFESNSDEQIKISVKTDSEEDDNDEALSRSRDDADISRAEQEEEESEAWEHKNSDGDRKSTYRMPTF